MQKVCEIFQVENQAIIHDNFTEALVQVQSTAVYSLQIGFRRAFIRMYKEKFSPTIISRLEDSTLICYIDDPGGQIPLKSEKIINALQCFSLIHSERASSDHIGHKVSIYTIATKYKQILDAQQLHKTSHNSVLQLTFRSASSAFETHHKTKHQLKQGQGFMARR